MGNVERTEENQSAPISEQTVLFSGRFCPAHIGHCATIIRLSKKYGHVLVPILRYDGRYKTASTIKQAFEEVLGHLGNVRFIINNDHFGRAPDSRIRLYHFDVYASGNEECLTHMESLGYKVEYLDDAYGIHATDIRTQRPEDSDS